MWSASLHGGDDLEAVALAQRRLEARRPGNEAAVHRRRHLGALVAELLQHAVEALPGYIKRLAVQHDAHRSRSEEHTSELQSLMRISYAVFCLNKKKKKTQIM